MANKKKSPPTYDLKKYIYEATKQPFPLQVDDETVIEIPPPSVNVILDLPGEEDPREAIRLMAGDSYDALIEAIGDQPAGVLKPIMSDMKDHFGLGE